MPESLDPAEAAPVTCAGITTFDALRHNGALPSDLVAAQGIGGLGRASPARQMRPRRAAWSSTGAPEPVAQLTDRTDRTVWHRDVPEAVGAVYYHRAFPEWTWLGLAAAPLARESLGLSPRTCEPRIDRPTAGETPVAQSVRPADRKRTREERQIVGDGGGKNRDRQGMKVPPVFESPAGLVPLMLLLCIAPTVEAAPWNVGYHTIAVQDALTSETFPVALWYPTREATTALFVTGSLSPCRFPAIFCRWIAYEMPVAQNAPAAAGVFGLIVVSHGAGGMALLHRDLGMALASQGYVVAAPTHARGTGNDISGVGVWVGRPKQVSGVIDVILDSTELGSHVDRGRIGVVGHSNGGFTALAVAGGKPSTSAVTAHCRQHPDDARFCAFGGAATRAATVEVRDIPELRDPRVRAIVLMAPNAAPFTDDALAHVTVPALVYAAENDDLTRVPYHAERLARALPQAECVLVKGAGHFSFVASFPAALKLVAGEAARDQPGFDRDALHELMNREIVGFFNRTLGPAGVSLTKAVQPPSCRPRESSDDTSPVPTLNGSRAPNLTLPRPMARVARPGPTHPAWTESGRRL